MGTDMNQDVLDKLRWRCIGPPRGARSIAGRRRQTTAGNLRRPRRVLRRLEPKPARAMHRQAGQKERTAAGPGFTGSAMSTRLVRREALAEVPAQPRPPRPDGGADLPRR